MPPVAHTNAEPLGLGSSLAELLLRWLCTWLGVFIILWLHRYVRLLVHCVSHWSYKSKPIPERPSYTSDDVTVVIPTIHNKLDELRPQLLTILACNPRGIILVTPATKITALENLAASMKDARIKVMSSPIANKRVQLCEALPVVTTPITIMADDDVFWPPTLLSGILAPFEDPRIGGVGTSQRVRRVWDADVISKVYNWLGAAYIERRNFEISATHNIDGGTSCMSGRTGAYRTEILQDINFLEGFKSERWFSYILNADDDNFVTRWLVSHQWKTWIQYDKAYEVETTMETGMKFLKQCLRWARSNWRSNFTSLVVEKHVWRQQPWCTYALHIATFTSLSIAFDPLILFCLWKATASWDCTSRQAAIVAQLVFMFAFTKVVKLMGLFLRNPSDFCYLPVSIIFGWLHGCLKVYALFTVNKTSWGSRADGDVHNAWRLRRIRRQSDSVVFPLEKLPFFEYEMPRSRRMTLPTTFQGRPDLPKLDWKQAPVIDEDDLRDVWLKGATKP